MNYLKFEASKVLFIYCQVSCFYSILGSFFCLSLFIFFYIFQIESLINLNIKRFISKQVIKIFLLLTFFGNISLSLNLYKFHSLFMNYIFTIITITLFICNTCHHSIPVTRMLKNPSIKANPPCITTGSNNQTALGLGNCFNNLYYININVGTPAQTMAVHFDTGSNRLWVPTQQVTGITPVFNTALSSTFVNTSTPASVQYADGSGVSGTLGTDILQIQNSLINISSTYLWATSVTNNNYPQQIQGLIGMGYTSIPNFLDTAFLNGEINSPVFSLQILDQTQQSFIHYNQIPQSIINSSLFQPVSSNFYWGVSVTGVLIGGVDMTASAQPLAIIDSGTSYFYLNSQLFSQIQSRFFSDCVLNIQNIPVCPCTSAANWPTFAFNFTNVEVFIQPEDYTYSQNNICTYLFGTISGFNEILLGDIFFRNYIITFDKINSQIGFTGARITNVTGSTPTVIIPDTTSDNAAGNTLSETLGWGLLGSMGIVALIGIFSCMCIQMAKDQFSEMVGLRPQFQLAQANQVSIRRRLS